MSVTVLGLLGAVGVAVSGAILPTQAGRKPPVWIFGHPATSTREGAVAGWCFLLGLLALTVAWILLVRSAPSLRRVVVTTAVWALPFVLGTPTGSADAHAYLAQGLLLDHGINPYTHGPGILHERTIVDAIDPRWRPSPAPYGPIALGVSRLAAIVGHDHPIAGLLVLRLFACLGFVTAAWCVVKLTGDRAATALSWTAASPLALISVVSAAHHEGVMMGFILAALLAHQRGRPLLAYALAMAAGMTKVPGYAVFGGLAVCDLWAARAAAQSYVSTVVRAAVAFAGVTAACALIVAPFGWKDALSAPGLARTRLAPVTEMGTLLPGTEHGWRTAGQVIAVLIVLALFATAPRRTPRETIGWSLLVVGLLGPVLYPWYFVPACMVLATTEGAWARRVCLSAGGAGMLVGLPRLGHLGAVA